MSIGGISSGREATRLGELSREQWTSGLAAWLGWLFDGLDMHLYTLVAMPFVAELLGADVRSAAVRAKRPRGFKPRSWSAGRSAADSSAASAIDSAAAGR